MDDTQTAVTDPPVTKPDEERIRVRAYALYEKRNGGAGDAESDWYAAEAELRVAPADTAK